MPRNNHSLFRIDLIIDAICGWILRHVVACFICIVAVAIIYLAAFLGGFIGFLWLISAII